MPRANTATALVVAAPAQVRTLRLTCLDGSLDAELLALDALREHLLADVDAALVARLAPARASFGEAEAPFLKLVNLEVRPAEARNRAAGVRTDFTHGGFSLRSPRTPYDLLYEIAAVAAERDDEAALIEHALAALGSRGSLSVNGRELRLEHVPLPELTGEARPERVTLWFRVEAGLAPSAPPSPPSPRSSESTWRSISVSAPEAMRPDATHRIYNRRQQPVELHLDDHVVTIAPGGSLAVRLGLTSGRPSSRCSSASCSWTCTRSPTTPRRRSGRRAARRTDPWPLMIGVNVVEVDGLGAPVDHRRRGLGRRRSTSSPAAACRTSPQRVTSFAQFSRALRLLLPATASAPTWSRASSTTAAESRT